MNKLVFRVTHSIKIVYLRQRLCGSGGKKLYMALDKANYVPCITENTFVVDENRKKTQKAHLCKKLHSMSTAAARDTLLDGGHGTDCPHRKITNLLTTEIRYNDI